MQALILVGGKGTRLRPLTTDLPKPVVSLVGQPFIGYMLQWLGRHGIDDIVMSCGFLSDGVSSVIGDGSRFGMRVRYIDEPEPLGTGGAVKFARDLLDERFFMLNGDVLTDIDLTAQLAQHERTGARATLALIAVDDPSAYGLVRLRKDLSVSDFIEKPGADQEIGVPLVNAGAYIMDRDVVDAMPPAGTNFSIERDVFPDLVGNGLYGYEANGYWLDIGTPHRYLQATFDILDGNVETAVGDELSAAERRLTGGASFEGRVAAPAVIGDNVKIGRGAVVGGRVVIGAGVEIGPGARIDSSVILDGTKIGANTLISGSIIDRDVTVGAHCQLTDATMLGHGVKLGDRNTLAGGIRISPDVEIPDGAVQF